MDKILTSIYNFEELIQLVSVFTFQLPWAQAKDACIAREQKMASVETPEKDDVLVQLFSEHLHTNGRLTCI